MNQYVCMYVYDYKNVLNKIVTRAVKLDVYWRFVSANGFLNTMLVDYSALWCRLELRIASSSFKLNSCIGEPFSALV